MKLNVKKLKVAMARKCYSVNDLVKETGLSRTTISRIMNGFREPSIKCAGIIARALNVDITELLSDEK